MKLTLEQERDVARACSHASGEVRVRCPACSPTRSPQNRNDKVLSVRPLQGRIVYHCWHCGVAGAVFPTGAERTFKREAFMMEKQERCAPPAPERGVISEEHSAWLRGRGVSSQVIRTWPVRTVDGWLEFSYPGACKRRDPDAESQRGSGKKVMSATGSALAPFGFDMLEPDASEACLFEGEIDCLVAASWGLPGCLSVPFGAAMPKSSAPWIEALVEWARANPARIVRLCFDDDPPGQDFLERMSAFLRASGVRYAPVRGYGGAKDFAEAVEMDLGNDARRMILSAPEPPVSGVVTATTHLEDVLSLYRGERGGGYALPWAVAEGVYSVPLGHMSVVTGYPNMGKSTWVANVLVHLCREHGLRAVIWSPEFSVERHVATLGEVYVGRSFFELPGVTRRMTEREAVRAVEWVDQNFFFLEEGEQAQTIEHILDRMRLTVLRYGVRLCVIDPYNYISRPDRMEQETEWVRRLLVQCRTFARDTGTHLFLVAHPKQQPQSVKDHIPRGESVSGGAHWRNVTDFGVTVHRPWDEERNRPSSDTEVHVWKSRFAQHGSLGSFRLQYNRETRRFEGEDEGFGF